MNLTKNYTEELLNEKGPSETTFLFSWFTLEPFLEFHTPNGITQSLLQNRLLLNIVKVTKIPKKHFLRSTFFTLYKIS